MQNTMQKLFDLFEEMGYGDLYFRQGSMSNIQYPPSFFTFWNVDTPHSSFYDNAATREIPYIQVGWYTNDANKIYSQLDEGGEFREKAKQKGFVFAGGAIDADADEAGYYGRVCYLRIIHNLKE